MRFNKIILTVALITIFSASSVLAKKKTYTGDQADEYNNCFNNQVGKTKCVAEQNACFADSVCYSASQWNWNTCSLGICLPTSETYVRNDTTTIDVPNVSCQKECDFKAMPAWNTESYHLYKEFYQCYYPCYAFLSSNYLQTMLGLSLVLLALLFSTRQ